MADLHGRSAWLPCLNGGRPLPPPPQGSNMCGEGRVAPPSLEKDWPKRMGVVTEDNILSAQPVSPDGLGVVPSLLNQSMIYSCRRIVGFASALFGVVLRTSTHCLAITPGPDSIDKRYKLVIGVPTVVQHTGVTIQNLGIRSNHLRWMLAFQQIMRLEDIPFQTDQIVRPQSKGVSSVAGRTSSRR